MNITLVARLSGGLVFGLAFSIATFLFLWLRFAEAEQHQVIQRILLTINAAVIFLVGGWPMVEIATREEPDGGYSKTIKIFLFIGIVLMICSWLFTLWVWDVKVEGPARKP